MKKVLVVLLLVVVVFAGAVVVREFWESPELLKVEEWCYDTPCVCPTVEMMILQREDVP